jgi:hypothetical protein
VARKSEMKHQLQAYIDGELEPAERARLEQACKRDAGLARELAHRQSLSDDMFASMKEHRLSRSMRQPVLDNLPEMDRRLLEIERARLSRERWQRTAKLLPVIAAALILVLGLALRYNWPDPLPSGDAIGVMVHASGTAGVYSSGDSVRRHAQLASYVLPGEIYETSRNGALMMRLVGNSTVRLSGDARLRVLDGRDIRLEKGTAFFESGPTGRLFRVTTQDAEIVVFGTAFEVAVYDGHTVVSVARGEVSVENAHGWRLLRSGQYTAVRADESPAQPEFEQGMAMRLAWADQIQPDANADGLYHTHLAEVLPPSIIGGVVVHLVDTTTRFGGRKPELESIRLRWNRGTVRGEVCGYDVYVNDSQNNSIFKYRISDAVFERSDATEYNIPIPQGVDRMPRVFNVRLVPHCETGFEQQIAFQVSAVPKSR